MNLTTTIVHLLQSGLGNLAAYLAAHVLLCLLPAFFIAGGLTALVPKEAIARPGAKFISCRWRPWRARCGGLLLRHRAALRGIYKKGAGLGPAITFLFFAPAGNILALACTGVAIGAIWPAPLHLLSFDSTSASSWPALSSIIRATQPRRSSPSATHVPQALFLFLLAALLVAASRWTCSSTEAI